MLVFEVYHLQIKPTGLVNVSGREAQPVALYDVLHSLQEVWLSLRPIFQTSNLEE